MATLLEKLKGLFSRSDIPDEARAIFEQAKTPTELLRGLDDLLTRNEVEAKELNAEIANVEEAADGEEARIRSGEMPERQKRNALLHVKRLRKQLDNYEGRLRIYERNMNLHLTLIGRIQQMEAMKLGGVDEASIDKIVVDFEEKLEKYHDVMNAADAHEGKASVVSAREERELRDLEQEILRTSKSDEGKEREPAPQVRETPEVPARRPIDEEGPETEAPVSVEIRRKLETE